MVDRLGPYLLGPNDIDGFNGIYTGDARQLSEAIPDESVDFVLDDPPFGIGFDYGDVYDDDPVLYPDLIHWLVRESNRIIKPGGLCFIFVAQPQLRDIWSIFPEDSRIFAACKNFVQMRDTPVQYAYDPVVFWVKGGSRLKEYKGRDFYVANTANTGNRGLNEAGFHPCPRPLDTIMYMIDNFCPENGTVCDFFMGSGTTAVAAQITGRKYLGFEVVSTFAYLARSRVANTQPPLPGLTVEQLALHG